MSNIIAKSFGEPVPVLDGRDLLDYGFCPSFTWHGGQKWYEYPFDIVAVAKLFRATSHHTSALITKRNVLVSLFEPNEYLSRRDFESLVQNWLVFNNGYLEVVKNQLGGLLKLKSRLALHVRRGIEDDKYYYIDRINNPLHTYQEKDMIHVFNPDITQEIYGTPDYLSSVNAILLNESATLFRRRYYKNGAHAGYILYLSDPLQEQDDVDDLEKAIGESKGAGNFKNLFMYVPGGKSDGVKVIPLAEVAAKDEFMNIKISSRDDQLAAHRVPPQLMGLVPESKSGFGDVKKAAEVFYEHEIKPLQNTLLDINNRLEREVIRFKDYTLSSQQD